MTEEKQTAPQPYREILRTLQTLGWNEAFQSLLTTTADNDLLPARVVGVRKSRFYVSQGNQEWLATPAGKIHHHTGGLFPVTGDWVMVKGTVIHHILPRKNALARGAAGSRGKQDENPTRQQVIAANLDTVFVVCGLDRDFNLRRIERYLTLVYNCGLSPAIILTKADLWPQPETFADDTACVAFGAPVHLVSAKEGTGLKALDSYLTPGRTVTMIGSSGAGKSTLLNRLYGASVQATGAVRDSDGKGKHTTTTRDLIMLPQGGMIIDNPGIREVSLWEDGDGMTDAFPDIERFALDCRFSDCTHLHEPGCRVQQAVLDGEIEPDRLASYHKLNRELSYCAQRQQKSADRLEKERWREIALKVKRIKKKKHKYGDR